MYVSKPYADCTPAEILTRMSPTQKNALVTLDELDWDKLNAQTRACLVDRTLTTASGQITDTGHQVREMILTDQAANREHWG